MSSKLGDRLATQVAAADQGVEASPKQSLSVLGWLNNPTTQAEIAKALPRGLDAARFMRQVQTEVRKNPQLLDADPRSFILGVLTTAQLGLELGPLGQAYLTGPYRLKDGRREVVLIIGYKGLCELAYRSETVDLVSAFTVHEGEPFKVSAGSDLRLEHEVKLELADAPAIAYYAVAYPRGSSRAVFDVMTPQQVDKVRARSKAKDNGPWVTDYEPMAQKTVLRRLLNRGRVRLSPQSQQAIAEDEERELGLDKAALLDPAMLPPDPPDRPTESEGAAESPEKPATASEGSAPMLVAESPKAAPGDDPGAAFRGKTK